MALAPIDYGPQVGTDNSGIAAAERATAAHSAVFAEARQLGGSIEGGAHVIAQGILHNQALKATAAVKERQASTLSFIESNPYVPKAVLQQRMSPEDYQAWHAGLATEYQEKVAVPMFTAAGALFDSEARQAREQAGAIIALPGWRGAWASTEQTESATIRERYVNRIAADQLVSDQRAQAMMSHDKLIESAQNKGDIEAAAKGVETSPWVPPAARRLVAEKDRVAMDSFDAEQAMRKQDVRGMGDELVKLRADNAAELFPHMTEHQRLDLAQRLERQYGFHAAKKIASDLISPNVSENGKVDTVAIAKALAAYKGDNKDEVVKATQAQESEALRVFDAQTSEIQQKVFTAGQDPKTGEFTMARAQANPAIAKAADWLNTNAPGKLGALGDRDIRRQRMEDVADRQAAADARRAHIEASHDSLSRIRDIIYDEGQADNLRKLTPSQWDSQLHDVPGGLTDEDLEKARKEFAAFQKRGGKSDERATTVVDAELKAAANGDATLVKKLSAKYRDLLIRTAHATIRDESASDPMAMAEKIHERVKAELVKGTVVGGGLWGDRSGVRYAEWETNPDYAGKDFQTAEGTTISHDRQAAVRLTKGGQTMDFRPENAAAARADGWK